MRCGRCGNDNAETNRFCGMCGAPLLSPPAAAAGAHPTPDPAPTPAPVAITGPSFLGLSTPGPASAPAPDSGEPPSTNLDYLLEDEEEPKRGPGKPIVALVALALAIAFGYLHWKQGGFDWLNGSSKPAASAPDAAPNAASGSSSTTPENASPKPADSSAPAAAPPTPAQTTAATNPAPDNAAAPNSAAPSQSVDSASSPRTAAPDESQADQSQADRSPARTAATPRSKPRKTAPARSPVPYDPVTDAERYIYGRGALQDCDRGLRLLKPAAQSNPKAMISMGALYSTGTCTPRDLPTAYRWFAQALHKQPDNQALQDDLKNLWEKMTPPERQLAIKLSH